ncbi:MAG: DNA polymerase III subunit delta [Dehalococcoidia bacterium]|nr:DNA polymerase III subunit delta [Dehalococcoidia bacterium]
MLHLVYGADSYSARQRLKSILSSNAATDAEESIPAWFEGKSAKPQEVLDACGQVSLFATLRQVVVEGLLTKFESPKSGASRPKKGRKKDAPVLGEWDGFAERAAALPESCILILLDGELKSSNPLLKALQSLAQVDEFKTPNAGQIENWIRNRAAEAGAQFHPDAIRDLSILSGGDYWQLSSEIEKLVTYADGRTITADVVNSTSVASHHATIFMLVDAIVEANPRAARSRLDAMYRDGLSAGYVFTMVGRQIRLIAAARELRATRGVRPQPSGELARLQPFALSRVQRQAARYTEMQVRTALDRLVAADRAVKTSTSVDRVALDLLITDLLPIPQR